MKALIYSKNQPNKVNLALKNIEIPKFNPQTEILVKVLGVGVCGTDLLKLDRALVKEGTVLGHEMIGEINQITPELGMKFDLGIGDRIISSHHVPCGVCNFCLNKQESLCTTFKATNFRPGAFCEYLVLSQDHLRKTVLKVPEHISNLEASFTEPIACCIKSLKKSGLFERLGKTRIVIYGLGSIGLIIGQLINHYRKMNKLSSEVELIGLDLIEYKQDLGLKLGFDFTGFTLKTLKKLDLGSETNQLELENTLRCQTMNLLNKNEAHLASVTDALNSKATIKALKKSVNFDDSDAHEQTDNRYKDVNLADQKADLVYLCAGSSMTLTLANQIAADGATIMVFSSISDNNGFKNNDIYYRELQIKSSYSPNLDDLYEALKLINSRSINVKDLVSHQALGLENFANCILDLKEEKGLKAYLNLDLKSQI
jgi:threonine dehydrogenase-like Zn-dependent dehydrogenase